MNAELYVTKASMLLAKGEIEKSVESMKIAIEVGNDLVSEVKAHSFLGEYAFIKQFYDVARQHLEWIIEQQEEIEIEYDDLLNDEINSANLILEIMKKFNL